MPYPDYNNSLVNLTSRIARNFNGPESDYAALEHQALDAMPDMRNVVLLVIDGLGYEYIQEHASFLKTHNQGRLTSVFPSTTASSISTFLTGQAPQQHGLTGWFVYLEEINEVTAVLPFRVRGGKESLAALGHDIKSLYGHPSFFDQLQTQSYIVSPDWIIDTEFNRSHAGSATSVPYKDLAGMCHAIRELAQLEQKKYIYAYWADFDHLSHVHGNGSDVVDEHFILLDKTLEKLSRELEGSNTLLLVTADHGFIDTQPEQMITVNEHPHMHECLRLPLCGEPRLAYCYLHEHKVEQFLDYVQQEFSGELECIESSRLIEKGVFGTGSAHPGLKSRVGDYTLVMRENFVIKDWLANEEPFFHFGVHGGNSSREIYVPLIAIES